MEQCGNCGRSIGKLEAAHVFGQTVVCGDCRGRLGGGGAGAGVMTVQQTAKVWKLLKLLSVLLLVLGVVFAFLAESVGSRPGAAVGVGMVVVGFGGYVVARFMAWWNHG